MQLIQFFLLQISSRPGHTVFEVILMKYPDLYALLANVPAAKQYFEALPDYVKEQISTRRQGINSFESLKDYADNLLRSDD